jgi:hypothetical protein
MRAKRWVDILFLASILGLIAVSAGMLRPEPPPQAQAPTGPPPPVAASLTSRTGTAKLTLASGAEVVAVVLTPVNLPASIMVGSMGRETARPKE